MPRCLRTHDGRLLDDCLSPYWKPPFGTGCKGATADVEDGMNGGEMRERFIKAIAFPLFLFLFLSTIVLLFVRGVPFVSLLSLLFSSLSSLHLHSKG